MPLSFGPPHGLWWSHWLCPRTQIVPASTFWVKRWIRPVGPEAGCEREVDIVGEMECFFLILEGEDAGHRTEDLFLSNDGVVFLKFEDRRLVVVALVQWRVELHAVAASDELALLLANLDILFDRIEATLVEERARS